jgi:hypothetical protein
MNKITLLLILLYFHCAGQTSVEIDLQKGSRLIEIIDLKEKGSFLISGKDVDPGKIKKTDKPRDLDTRLHYVSADLNQKWDKAFPLEPDNLGENYYVACSDSFIYYVEILAGNLKKSNYLITQIDYSGVTRIFEYNIPFKIDKLYDLYCDKDNIYLFYDELKDSKKPYHFLGLSHSRFENVSVDIALPKILKKKEELSYDRRIFLGIFQNQFYFYSKNAKSSKSCTYEFTLVNKKGEITKTFIIEGDLDADKSIAPTNNPHINQSYTESEFNFFTSGELKYPAIGSVGDIYMDFENGFIYLFGNFSSGPFNNTGQAGNTDGLFVNKFDLNGKLIWKKNIPFPKEAKDPLFRSSLYPDRNLFFTIDPHSGNIFFDIIFGSTKKQYTFILDKEANYIKMNAAETGTIPNVDRAVFRTPQNYKGETTLIYKKPNKYVDNTDTKGMRKMEELSKMSTKKTLGNKQKNPEYALFPSLFYLQKTKHQEILIESSFGEGKIKLYLLPY